MKVVSSRASHTLSWGSHEKAGSDFFSGVGDSAFLRLVDAGTAAACPP